MIKNLRKYVLFNHLAILCGFSIAWLLKEESHSVNWVLYGLIGGFLLLSVGFLFGQKKRRTWFNFLPLLLYSSAGFAFLSIWIQEFLGLSVGNLIASTFLLLTDHLLHRKMLTWEDLRLHDK